MINSSGDYKYKTFNALGCLTTQLLHVRNFEPVIANITSSRYFCKGGTSTLESTDQLEYH